MEISLENIDDNNLSNQILYNAIQEEFKLK